VLDCGAEVAAYRHCGDSAHDLEAVLREVAQNCDIVITSGGVSAGDFDPVRDVLLAQAEVYFWKIAMKPGKPVMFACFESKPVLALPGNPASAMVAFEILARPALLQMGGRHCLKRLEVPVRLQAALRSQPGRTEFARCTVLFKNGEWQADFPTDQGSGRLSTMTNANALLVVPAETTALDAGATLMARLIECPDVE
jgi:molybdopterin biosynthesis enzyme